MRALRGLLRSASVWAGRSRGRVAARPYRWAAATCVGLLCLTAAASLYVASVERELRSQRIERDAELAVRTIDKRLVAYGEMLVAVRGLFEIDPHPTRARFAQFVSSLQLDERYPGVRAVSFAHAVDVADQQQFEQMVAGDKTAAAAGYPPLKLMPAFGQTRMVVVDYLEPVLGNEAAMGLDLLGDPTRARAVELTQNTGRPAATAPIRLVQDTGNEKAFVFMQAVRNVGGPLTSVRTGRLHGVVTAAFEIDDLLDGILGDRARDADVEVYDVGEWNAAAPQAPGTTDAIYGGASLGALGAGGPSHALIPINVGGRRWLVYFAPRARAASSVVTSAPWAVALGGVIGSLLATWLLLMLAQGRTRAVALAGRITGDLEASVRHTRQILVAAHDAFVSIDEVGGVSDWNPQAEALFGWSRAEVLGRDLATLIVPPGQRDAHRRGVDRFRRTGQGAIVGKLLELTAVDREGREFPIEFTISVVETGAGYCFNAFMRDISERRTVEETLRRSSRYFELARDLTLTAGFDGVFKSVNPVVTEILGWSEEEFLSRPFMEFVHPDDRAQTAAEMERLGTGALTFSFVNRYQAKDGSYHWIDWNATVPADDDVIYASGRDISERVQMELALRKAEERFREAFDGAPIGVCLLSLGSEEPGRLMQANPTLAGILGYGEDELTDVTLGSLIHPEDHDAVADGVRALANGVTEHWELEARLIHRGGDPVWTVISAAPLSGESGLPPIAVTHVMDISDRKQFEYRLQFLADHDALTGLFNRRRFGEELESAVNRARRYEEDGAVLFLDLDGFKFVNDTLGHAAGDELITRVAGLLAAELRSTDILARVGGDEFAVLLTRCNEEHAIEIAQGLLATLRLNGGTVRDDRRARVSSSIGITVFDGDRETTADELVVEADIAMYDAKEAGKDRYCVYERTEGRRELMSIRENWSERLRGAVDHDRFVLQAQPIVPICASGPESFELLLRLPGTDGELIPPGTFLYNAERFGLIEPIDRWVLRQAVGHLSDAHAAGLDLQLAVNVSGQTMSDGSLAAFVAELLAEKPVRPDRLVIEITETAAITNIDRAKTLARELQRLGCRIALDDFGAGFASFYYLKHLNFDYLKIDGEFIRNLTSSPTDQLVVEAVVSIAHGLDTRTIAEFVGDDATVELLRKLGVDHGQGYHLGRPVALDQALPHLRRLRAA